MLSQTSSHTFARRVSFDLSHNVVYLLPTIEECRNAAKQKHREEWERRSLNEDMLSEDIIAEIQEEWSAGSEEEAENIMPKSCLKKPPTDLLPLIGSSPLQKKKKKNNKRKRGHARQLISVN